ncbi:MAG: serine hydrolase [Halieaceae bacterium]|jgi:CubicO group peptidase (beta-lactamase class C family)|nr:serine hydrolase [Halieaceae bacterium]
MRKASLAAIGTMIFAFAFASFVSASPDYQQWLDEAYPADGPGAAVIVVRDNEVLFRSAAGMADMELGVPLTPANVFRIGSITKQFTAAGILLLEEQGKLSVSDNINKYLPDYPTQGHTIKIENLLSHTSGIFNYTDIPGYFDGAAIRKDVTTEELIAVFANLPMNFAPGEAYSYSNSGYVLLGAIIEKVSGQTYAEFMQTAIFDKLGLKHSYHGGPQIILNRAHGYQGEAGDYSNAAYLSMTQPHGAGALLSTVDDLAQWSNALFGGELLSKESLKKMTTDFELNNGEHAGYGFGLGVRERFGEREIAHNGGIHGFSTSGIWLPKQKIYAAVLSNHADSGSPDFLAARMAFDAAGADYPKLVAIEIDADKLPQYLGVYRINENETRNVMLEDGRLYTQRTGGGRLEIVAHAEDAFFYPGGFTHLVFRRDRSGNVTAMDMYQGGADKAERAERVSDLPQGKWDAVDVSAEVYDLWAGNYAMASGATLAVRRDGSQLFVQLTGQPPFEVFPLSVTRYFLKDVDAELEFTAGDDGRGKTVVIYQNGTEEVANRVD